MGKEKIAAEWVGKQYREKVRAFSKKLPDPELRLGFSQEADAYFRRCARAIWHRGNGITQEHVDAYNAICSAGNEPPKTLYFELASAVAGAPEFTLPGFFSDLLRTPDQKAAIQFAQLCSELFMLFTAADGCVNADEVAYADQCVTELRQAAGEPQMPESVHTISSADKIPDVPSEQIEISPAANDEMNQPAEDESVEDLLAELDALCGLEQVKKDVRSLINLVKVRRLREENDLPVPPMSLHLVFLGNPGTGKTTVARLLARLYHAIGVLSKGQLVETDRSGLVAGYVGQTAIKTQEVIQSALGGVLFIDEAYSLSNKESANDFGQEAIEILLKNMEDHRDDLIVIVAGYTELMQDFIHANPGLSSRFSKYFYFSDYNAEELFAILESMCAANGYHLSDSAAEKSRRMLEDAYEKRDEHFGNARDVRNLFEALVARQSDRLAQAEQPSREDLMLLTADDFDAAVTN